MELSILDELSMWDSVVDPQSTACIGDGSKVWANGSNGAPGAFNVDEGDEHLLLNELDSFASDEFCDWMETKFNFEECNMTLLEDVERLLMDEGCLEPPKIVQVDNKEVCNELATFPSVLNTVFDDVLIIQATTPVDEDLTDVQVEVPSVDVKSEVESSGDEVVVLRLSSQRCTKRAKPYSRTSAIKTTTTTPVVKSESRKTRKRSQNRDAATRYRIKKREEAELLAAEESKLKSTNTELQMQVDNLSREVNYLKSLMKELIVSKRK